MKIKYVKGDLLDCQESVIAHGCNAQGKMNSGVARVLRAKYPNCWDVYKNNYENGLIELGQVQISTIGLDQDKVILNCITQKFYGYDKEVYVSYDALKKCMAFIDKYFQRSFDSVAMPKIGAGLGGGDWDIIEDIIESTMKNVQPVVYEL